MKSLLLSLRRFRTTRLRAALSQPKDYFTHTYLHNSWRGQVSRSGQGSEGAFALQKVRIIQEVSAQLQISRILDFGCGDFYWMKEVVTSAYHYHGVDIVNKLVEINDRQFGAPNVSFQCLDLTNQRDQSQLSMRQADLVVCLDVFGHLLNNEVSSLLRFILCDLDITYFLVTNRREAGSTDYLWREKTREEGIDLEVHPLFIERHPTRLKQIPALYPNDFFDLYELRKDK
jgi:hypothetical protein